MKQPDNPFPMLLLGGAIVLFLLIILTGCGGSSEPASTSTAAALTKPAAKVYTAYDSEVMADAERQVKSQMHSIAASNDGDEEDLTVQCIADTDRAYTCGASTTLSFDDGMGGKLCTEIKGTAKGTINPSSGIEDWKMISTDADDEPTACY